jgi:cytosine/adenosine deaminase-related metal-dependent hydrolase
VIWIRNATVATLDAEDRVFDPGEVWIRDGRVLAAGPVGQTPPPDELLEVIDAPSRIVIPGLVNAHIHSYAALLKGTIDALPADLYMLEVIAAGSHWTPRHVYVSALVSCLDLLRTGTTAVIDHFSYRPAQTTEALDAVCQAYQDAGIRAVVAPMFADRPFIESVPLGREMVPDDIRAAWQVTPTPDRRAYFDVVRATLDKWTGRGNRLGFLCGVDGPQRCSRELLEMTGEFCARHGLGLHTHLLETKIHALTAPPEFDRSFVAYLDRFGLVNPRSSLVHFNWCAPRDVDLAVERGVNVVHVPLSGLMQGGGIQPAIRLLGRGIPVALGTDGANCGTLSLWEKARLATLLSRVTETDYEHWITAREALRMATAHGARALGMTGGVGVIAPGARADLVILDAGKAPYRPRGNLWNHLVYYESGAGVETVMVEGEIVVNDGEPTRFNAEDVLTEAEILSAQILRDSAPALAAARRQYPIFRRMILEAMAAAHPLERRALLR